MDVDTFICKRFDGSVCYSPESEIDAAVDAAVAKERRRCVLIVDSRTDGGTDAGKHLGDGDLGEMIREIEGGK
jgi:hypothetical protein